MLFPGYSRLNPGNQGILDQFRSEPLTPRSAASTIMNSIRALLFASALTLINLQTATAQQRLLPPPSSLHLNSFYQKYCDAGGIPIVGSSKVSDSALLYSRDIVLKMLAKRPDVLKKLKEQNIRITVMATTEVTTDVPEHSDLNTEFPIHNWNTRARGVGATEARPVCSCAEENVLQLRNDRYLGENILIHEFGHTVLNMGIAEIDPNFVEKVKHAFEDARGKRLWDKTYAASNYEEYWAEGVQDWFDANLTCTPANGIHNEIWNQAQLRNYDRPLYDLLERVFPSNLKWDRKYGLVSR